MITFTKSYKTEDGQVFGTIEEAQRHELEAALKSLDVEINDGRGDGQSVQKVVAAYLLSKKDVVIDILTMTPNSKPKARSIHGGTKTRKPKTVITDAAVSIGSTTNVPTSVAPTTV